MKQRSLVGEGILGTLRRGTDPGKALRVAWHLVLAAPFTLTLPGCTRSSENALERIKALGGKVGMARRKLNQPVVSVALRGTAVADADLVILQDLPQLQKVDLSFTGITDAGLRHLEHLAKLRTVLLEGTRVTDGGVKRLHEALPEATILR
jgi:hypothetical protein